MAACPDCSYWKPRKQNHGARGGQLVEEEDVNPNRLCDRLVECDRRIVCPCSIALVRRQNKTVI